MLPPSSRATLKTRAYGCLARELGRISLAAGGAGMKFELWAMPDPAGVLYEVAATCRQSANRAWKAATDVYL